MRFHAWFTPSPPTPFAVWRWWPGKARVGPEIARRAVREQGVVTARRAGLRRVHPAGRDHYYDDYDDYDDDYEDDYDDDYNDDDDDYEDYYND